MSITDYKIHGLTTIIRSIDLQGTKFQGTGFFFHKLSPKILGDNYEYEQRDITENWLVTNRHVVLTEDESGRESLPQQLYFHLPKSTGSGNMEWEIKTLEKTELQERLRVNKDERVDVAAINVSDMRLYYGVSEDDLPRNKGFYVSVGTDIIAVGFPEEFYDQVNNFPVVKAGIVSSPYDLNFDGERKYLIDAKLFNGSSGSVILAKPFNDYGISNSAVKDVTDELIFLGIYSGAPYIEGNIIEAGNLTIIKKEDYNLGIVWHPDMVIETVNNGIPFNQ